VAVKQVRVSDLSGRQATEDQLAKLVVHEHPQYQGPITLDVVPEELGSYLTATSMCPSRSSSPGSAAASGRCWRWSGSTSWPQAAT
jgi:hypothetical protein